MESCQPIKRLKDKKKKKKKRCENNPTFLRGKQKVRSASKQTKQRRRAICYRSGNIRTAVRGPDILSEVYEFLPIHASGKCLTES